MRLCKELSLVVILVLIVAIPIFGPSKSFAQANVSSSTVNNNSDNLRTPINTTTLNHNTTLSILELSEQLENNVTSIVGVNATDVNTTEINNLLPSSGPNVTSTATTNTTCNTISGITSSDIGLNDQIPCTVVLSGPTKEYRIDVDYQIIQNDNSDDITYFNNNQQIPDTLNLEQGELFVFARTGGSDHDSLNVYIVDKNTGDGDIINLDNTQPARIFLEHIRAGTTDIFKVPEIDDGVSEWKMVISYEVNDELESTYIANKVTID